MGAWDPTMGWVPAKRWGPWDPTMGWIPFRTAKSWDHTKWDKKSDESVEATTDANNVDNDHIADKNARILRDSLAWFIFRLGMPGNNLDYIQRQKVNNKLF